MPGDRAPPDRTAEARPDCSLASLFTVGGIGGIVLLVRRRPPLSVA